jgi:hypothetical protein
MSCFCVTVSVRYLEHYPFQVRPIYCFFKMWFSCKSILILNFRKCKNFPLGPLKNYLLAWLYDYVLSTENSVIYPPMVLSNQLSTALDTALSNLLTFWINADVQTTGGLDLISNWVSANLANHSNNSWWIPPKKIS